MGQIRTWQPVQNSAPIRRRLVEKPLKTVLCHQNDYQWPKTRKVAWLYFRCDHFEGHMSHILRTVKKKSTPSAINTLVNRELRFGGYPSRRSRITTAPAGEIEQVGESCTRWGRTGVQMRKGRTRTQRQKDHSKAEKVKTMKTRDQRRQRRLLGSVFVGPAPQKRSLAGAASCFLPHMVAPLMEKACQMGSKYTCQIWRKIWQKTAKKRTKLTVNHQSGTKFGHRGCFSDVLAQLVNSRGYNRVQLRKHEPIPNSAPYFRRLPEKLLKTILIHQNDHHRPNRRKVAFLEFHCNHFKGPHCGVLRRAVFQGGGVP